jgi:hypothetical protein
MIRTICLCKNAAKWVHVEQGERTGKSSSTAGLQHCERGEVTDW